MSSMHQSDIANIQKKLATEQTTQMKKVEVITEVKESSEILEEIKEAIEQMKTKEEEARKYL